MRVAFVAKRLNFQDLNPKLAARAACFITAGNLLDLLRSLSAAHPWRPVHIFR